MSISKKVIIVAGYGGQDGKSTISKHLLKANFDDAVHVAVEVANDAAGADMVLPPTQPTAVKLEELASGDKTLIVDIGASSLRGMQAVMQDFEHVFAFADAIVVPIRAGEDGVAVKSSADHVLQTIGKLTSMSGIRPDQIYVVPNAVPFDATTDQDVEAIFGKHVAAVRALGCSFVSGAAVRRSATYDTMRASFPDESILDLVGEAMDTKDPVRKRIIYSAQKQLAPNLRQAFAALCEAAGW